VDHDLVVERIETRGDVTLNEPGRARPGVGHLAKRGVASPAGPVPVGPVGKLGFVVRLKQQAYHLTDQLVRPRRQAQRSTFPVAFRDVDSPGWAEPVALVA